ncbi:hypothetical protein EXIGLDRAFT_205373 [Exidia glandulosa HHB12029]|uniref:Uncharacterized protein n=1 Tax=Exidia glandulosa HHB12029 TaxID=1314781 RepID=A0A165MUQ2_EXIGL|nr:hypothetical protein EXIGLDRAFT_205373 [Exidia glandulosa HHB12029]
MGLVPQACTRVLVAPGAEHVAHHGHSVRAQSRAVRQGHATMTRLDGPTASAYSPAPERGRTDLAKQSGGWHSVVTPRSALSASKVRSAGRVGADRVCLELRRPAHHAPVRGRLQIQTRGGRHLRACVETRPQPYTSVLDTLYRIVAEERSDVLMPGAWTLRPTGTGGEQTTVVIRRS